MGVLAPPQPAYFYSHAMPASPLKWYGGKGPLAKKIIKLFPPHTTYVETCGGGASVLLAKPPAPIEIYNDLNTDLNLFWGALRDHTEEFVRLATLTPYSKATWENAKAAFDEGGFTSVEMAVLKFVMWRQSFAGMGNEWARSVRRHRKGMAENVAAWLGAVERLPEIALRLQSVQLEMDVDMEVAKRYDGPDTLVYHDPPYALESRVAKAVYAHEKTDAQHEADFAVLDKLAAKVVVSGYHCPLYDRLFKNWHTHEIDVACHAAGGKEKGRRIEVLWCNFTPTTHTAGFGLL